MSKHPVPRAKTAAATRDSGSRAVVAVPDRDVVAASPSTTHWLNFRYSYTEISARGAGATVKHNEVRFEDGTLKSESFEGTVDARAFEAAMREAQTQLLRQTQQLLRSLFWFLPAPLARSLEAREDQDLDPHR